MDIFIKESSEPTLKKKSLTETFGRRRESKRERRKAVLDRRKSVNEGLIVSLSVKKDRRSGPDRRKSSTPSPVAPQEGKQQEPAKNPPETQDKENSLNLIV